MSEIKVLSQMEREAYETEIETARAKFLASHTPEQLKAIDDEFWKHFNPRSFFDQHEYEILICQIPGSEK